MKLFVKALAVIVLLGLIAWALVYIGSAENSINLRGDWGIAKDRPIR
jgi:uracil-DNA glycosylase